MFGTAVKISTALLLFALTPPLSAQVPVDWDGARLQQERDELERMLEQYRSVVASEGYSAGLRREASLSADRIQERLIQGDFGIGDLIALRVQGYEAEIPDTVTVEMGPAIVIPQMGVISLKGVLRSELQEHLSTEFGRYLIDPVVFASSTIRLAVESTGVRFYTFPADMLLSEALMAGGGVPTTDLDRITLRRADEILVRGEEVELALQQGRSLDQLNLRAGDRIVIPIPRPSRIWPTVFRWGALIASTTLLGIRIYR